jgi:protein SMG6
VSGDLDLKAVADDLSDTGVKPILKNIHDKIRDLEATLTELHRKMSADPETGISLLLDRGKRRSANDPSAWMDLIGKHKE